MSPRAFERWLFGKWGPLEKKGAAWLKDAVWPEGALCCACGRVTEGGTLCAACRDALRDTGFAFAWDMTEIEPGLPAWSLRPYGGVAKELVLRLKFDAEARAAEALSELLLPLPDPLPFPPDTVVTWVTMPESRRRVRCVDHGRLLAEAFAEKLSMPCRQLLLRRDRREKRQVGLNEKQRRDNLHGAFRPAESVSCPVLVVDDVRTTGTTLCRAAAALREGGAPQVFALTVTARN